jgi:hypothetical protein
MIQRFFMLAPRIAALPPDVLMAGVGLPDMGPLSPALVSTPAGSEAKSIAGSAQLHRPAEEIGRVRPGERKPALAGPCVRSFSSLAVLSTSFRRSLA